MLSINFYYITNEIRHMINNLKSNRQDAQDINKSIRNLIIMPLTNLVNRYIKNDVFFNVLSLSKVIPIHNKGSHEGLTTIDQFYYY